MDRFSGLAQLRHAKRLTAAAALVLSMFVLSSCSNSKPLSQCMVGSWRNPLDGGCLCPTEPECQSSDCVGIDFKSFQAGGTYYSGTVTWSNQSMTMSSEGAASTGTFTVDDKSGVVTLVSSSNAQVQQTLTCSGDSLTVNGANYTRANASLGATLSGALAQGLMWKSYPLAH